MELECELKLAHSNRMRNMSSSLLMMNLFTSMYSEASSDNQHSDITVS